MAEQLGPDTAALRATVPRLRPRGIAADTFPHRTFRGGANVFRDGVVDDGVSMLVKAGQVFRGEDGFLDVHVPWELTAKCGVEPGHAVWGDGASVCAENPLLEAI